MSKLSIRDTAHLTQEPEFYFGDWDALTLLPRSERKQMWRVRVQDGQLSAQKFFEKSCLIDATACCGATIERNPRAKVALALVWVE